MPSNKSSVNNAVQQLAELLTKNNLMLAMAESCTGGMLAQHCTSQSGSSKWFECGFVTYSYSSKTRLLGVEADVLEEHGAVNAEVAEQMAIGVLNHCDADISVSITGIAGPGGGSTAKPVGTVYIATAVKKQPANAIQHLFHGDRQSIREQSAAMAIQQLMEILHD